MLRWMRRVWQSADVRGLRSAWQECRHLRSRWLRRVWQECRHPRPEKCLAGVPVSEVYMCRVAVLVYEDAGNNSGSEEEDEEEDKQR